MRKELFIHFAFWFSFFVFISIFKNHLSFTYWPFWLGGIIGTLLPDADHFIYVFLLNPQDLTSQRVSFLLRKKEVFRIATLLYETRRERKNLVLHTFLFQIVFLILTFLILTSSSSLLAHGIVLAFSLHLAVDQLADFLDTRELNNWGRLFSAESDSDRTVLYISTSFLLVCIMGFLM